VGSSQRAKGARGELEFARLLASELGVDALRQGMAQSRDPHAHADVEWPGCPWWIECKRGAKPNHRAALHQARSAVAVNGSERMPVVLARDDRADAVAVMLLSDWLPMARAFLQFDELLDEMHRLRFPGGE